MKRNRLLRVLCSFMVAALLCGSLMVASADEVSFDEPMEIDMMAYFVDDIGEDSVVKFLEEKFNVKFNFTITLIDSYPDALNLRISGGDIPEWFRVTNQTTFDQLAEDGLLLNVSEMVDKYGFENIKDTFELNNADILANDGVFYRIPDTLGCLNNGVYYRKDWLDALNLEVPTTWDELAEVFKAFAEADLDGVDACGVTSYGNGIMQSVIKPSFMGYCDWGMDADGNVVNYRQDEHYKDVLKYWKNLYVDGVLDPEVMANNYMTAMEKFATGRAGALMMNINSTWYDKNTTDILSFKEDAEVAIASLPPLEGPAGAYIATYFPFSADSCFSADLSEEKAARILAIFDYLLSDEGRDLTLYGVDDEFAQEVDGVKVQLVDEATEAWSQNIHFFGEIADFGSTDRLITNDELKLWAETVSDPTQTRSNKMGYFVADPSVNAAVSEANKQFITPFLTGEMDIDAEWEHYQQALKDAGIDKLVAQATEYVEAHGITLDPVLD